MNLPLEMGGAGLTALSACIAAAVVMGIAIQRGATCTVAAVDEIVSRRRFTRLLAIGEAALWVLGGLLMWRALVGLPEMPRGFPVGHWTIVGGVLLGLGAFVNRACVFGALARLGSGEWAYAFTPVGYFAGCALLRASGGWSPPLPSSQASPALAAPVAAVALLLIPLAWRAARLWQASDRGRWTERAWSPHVATCVIGLTFVVLLLFAGPWAYTDVLAELARGMASMLPSRVGLAGALMMGAILGGRIAGVRRRSMPSLADVARCLLGGALMAWGTLLIPGGNDGLLLLGMPLLWPYAWAAFAVMCATIATALLAQRKLAGVLDVMRRRPER